MWKSKGYGILLWFALTASAPVFAEVPELDRLVGKDLWKERELDLRRLNEMLGEIPKGDLLPPSPWHVWRTSRAGRTRYVVVLGEDLFIIPGECTARILLLDASGGRINGWSFQAGWRLFLTDASFEPSANVAGDLVVLRTERAINGRDIAKEYFAIGDDRLRLVRLENSKGEAVQNEYVFPNYELGIAPDAKSPDQFVALLESSDKADVLSALVFLGGQHLDDARRMSLPEPHESKYAALFQEAIGDPRIQASILRLTMSDNEWIRQAARLAARGPRERLFE